MTFWRNRFALASKADSDSYDESIEQSYINRELSWLDFNLRVLEEAEARLLERVRVFARHVLGHLGGAHRRVDDQTRSRRQRDP